MAAYSYYLWTNASRISDSTRAYGSSQPTPKEINTFLLDKRNEQIKKAWSKNRQWVKTNQKYRLN